MKLTEIQILRSLVFPAKNWKVCVFFSKKTKMPVLKNAITEITQYMGLIADWKELREELEKWKVV